MNFVLSSPARDPQKISGARDAEADAPAGAELHGTQPDLWAKRFVASGSTAGMGDGGRKTLGDLVEPSE